MDTREMPLLDSEEDTASVDESLDGTSAEISGPRWGITNQALVVGVLAAIAGWFMHVLSERNEREAGLPELVQRSAEEAATTMVTVANVEARTIPQTIDVIGTLNCFEEIPISAEVDGTISKIYCDVSKRVATGDVLLEIDPTEYRLDVEEAERMLQVELAQLGLKEAPPEDWSVESLPSVMQAKARLKLAENRLARLRSLTLSNAASEADLDAAVGDFEAFLAERDGQILAAKSRLATLRMKLTSLEISRQKLLNTQLVAPQLSFAGEPVESPPLHEPIFVVAERSVSEGSYVRAGTEALKLVIDSRLKMRASVPEKYAPEVVLGQKANVTTAALREPRMGVVTKIFPVVDPSKRTFDVEIQIDNQDRAFLPGNFAKAAILVAESQNATTVPLESIVSSAGLHKIFLLQDNVAKEVRVRLGRQNDQWIEIVEPPLPGGGLVITSGQLKLFDGSPVKIRESQPAETEPASNVPSAELPQSSSNP